MRLFRGTSALLPLLALVVSCSNREGRSVYTGVVEGTSVHVSALTGGEITALYADTGDRVEAEQLLAQIDTTDLSFQRGEIEAALEEAEIQQTIAATALERSRSELAFVRQSYDRLAGLLKGGAVTEQSVDDARNRLHAAESVHRTASEQVRTARARGQQLAARLDAVRKRIRDATVRAPLGGVVTNRYYERGEAVPAMQPLFEIIETAEVWVKIYVGEPALPSIRIGREVRVNVDGFDRPLGGTILWISPKAEFTPKQILTPETRTSLVYAVKVKIPNPEGILKHGMPVEIEL